jgi:hypothetical protein
MSIGATRPVEEANALGDKANAQKLSDKVMNQGQVGSALDTLLGCPPKKT